MVTDVRAVLNDEGRETRDRHGGAIHVVDNEPRGAVFVVDLPVAFDA